jgi:precorrin-2 dehydrogenase / sirohydrochlorin ferrochelatase
MNTFPITLQSDKFRPLLIGGGKVAVRKLKGLLRAGLRPMIISADFCTEMQEIILEEHLEAQLQHFTDDMMNGYNLIIATTSDKALNNRISEQALAHNLLVNNASSAQIGNFIIPAVIDRNRLKIAVSTAGEYPLLSGMVRSQIDKLIHPDADQLLERLAEYRKAIVNNTALSPEEKQTAIDQQLKPLAEDMIRILFSR